MKVELKNIKHAAFASDETECYEAILYVNGQRVARVANEGHGGPDMVSPLGKTDDEVALNRRIIADVEAYFERQAPVQTEWGEVPQSLELHCADLLAEWLLHKEVKKALRRICYTKLDGTDVYQLPAKYKADRSTIARFKAGNPQVHVLNELPFPKALEAFQTAWKQQA